MKSTVVAALLIALLVAVDVCKGDHHSTFAEKYPFSANLYEGFYNLYWNFSSVDQTIHFAVKVKTTGWVGFGISPNGQMPGSDVIIAWVDGDNAYFHDRYAERRSLPTIDPMQDWFLISAAIHDGYTELEFSRNFTTCDKESRDLDILAETSRIVFSWNNNKPTVNRNGDSETYTIMAHQTKASASVNLLGGLPVTPELPQDMSHFTVGVSNVELPSTSTTYWCKGIRLDSYIEDIDQTKQYIIKFDAKLSESSKNYVHHMLVYTCNGLNETDLGSGGQCSQQSDRINLCRGSAGLLIAAWAVGGVAFTYPENVAYPIGGPNSHMYAVIEMHYNNPNKHSGVIDSSGVVFSYISTPREHDAGIMFVGHQVYGRMAIPPKATNYTVSAFCSSKCTHEFLPDGGIKIFANMLHTHLAGIGISLSVLRSKGSGMYREEAVVEKNLKYDFNFQQANHLSEAITVLPGDLLLLNCYYNTEKRTVITTGGESTQEEMCLSFPIYYPRIEMNNCESSPIFNQLNSFFMEYVPEQDQMEFENLTYESSPEEIYTAFNMLEWTDEQVKGLEQKIYMSGYQHPYCYSDANFVDSYEKTPVVSEYYIPPTPVRNCTSTLVEPDGATVAYVQMGLLLFMMSLTYVLLA